MSEIQREYEKESRSVEIKLSQVAASEKRYERRQIYYLVNWDQLFSQLTTIIIIIFIARALTESKLQQNSHSYCIRIAWYKHEEKQKELEKEMVIKFRFTFASDTRRPNETLIDK